MAFYGADTGQLRAYSEIVRRGDQRLVDILESLDSGVQATDWVGADAESFRSEWSSLKNEMMQSVSSSLRRCSEDAERNADEQDEASEGDEGGSFPWGPLPFPLDGLPMLLQEDSSRESDGFFGDLLGGPESGYWGSMLWNLRSMRVDVLGFIPDPTGITNIAQLPDDIANTAIGLYDAAQSFQDGDLFGTMDGLITAGINGADGLFNVIGAIPTPPTKIIGEFGGMITGGLDMGWSGLTALAQGSAIAGGPGEGSTTRFLVEAPGFVFDQVTGTTWGSNVTETMTGTADANYARLTESVREHVPFIDPIIDASQGVVQSGADNIWGDAVEGAAETVNGGIRSGIRNVAELFT